MTWIDDENAKPMEQIVREFDARQRDPATHQHQGPNCECLEPGYFA